MAAQYDQLGNYLGDWETDEEREKREQLEANRAVQTQEIKTYGDGTVEETTRRELQPAQTTAIQPVSVRPVQQQPVQQPISPDTFNRMIQVESGGRNFNAQGQPLTSPKGAMFANQVMPATAASPGFGVRPAQAQTAEEYNRVGADLYQALLQQFNGDERKAAAAYNAGYGRVQKNIAANQGQMNEAQLPQETQGYLQKVFSGVGNAVNAVIPSAQAGTVPAPRNVPQAFPGDGVAVATGRGVQGTQQTEAQRQLEVANQQIQQNQQNKQQTSVVNRFVDLQDDDIGLIAVKNNDNATEFEKRWAGDRLYDRMRQSVEEGRAKEQAKQLVTAAGAGDRQASNTLAKELQKQEGSWVKMILLGFISPQMAGEEAIKLGFGNKWVQGYDENGKSALMQVNAKGMPLQGFTADGKAIADNDLAAYMTGGKAGGTKADVSTQDVERNGQAGRVITQHLPNGQTKTMVESNGKLFPYDTSWKSRDIPKSAAKADYGLMTDLKKKHGTNVLDAEKDYVSINGPFKSQEERQQFRQVYGFDLAQPAGQVAPAGAPATAVQPSTQAAQAPVSGPAVPGAPQTAPASAPAPQTAPSNITVPLTQQKQNVEITETGRKEIIKKAGDVVANSDKLVGEITNAERAAQDALTKPNNFGTLTTEGATILPGEQTIGKFFKTQDAVNTLNILDTVNKVAATNAKMLGTNPTDRDLQFVTSTKPDETWSPSAVAEWLRRSAEGTRRTLDFARKQIETGGKFIPETPQENKEIPTKKLSRDEQQAVEWLRKNPNDPRAAEIKKRLGL